MMTKLRKWLLINELFHQIKNRYCLCLEQWFSLFCVSTKLETAFKLLTKGAANQNKVW